MGWKQRYARRKEWLTSGELICESNRRLFSKFFRWEERKLRRINGLRQLDEACYKTLYAYTVRLANVNQWFGNRPWNELTIADVRRVYNALEDGRILNRHGRPFEDLRGYYGKVFKAKPFALADKVQVARQVIEYTHHKPREVRFVEEESFERLVAATRVPSEQLLLWLAWDIGENIGTLLKLTTDDLTAQANRQTGEREYLVHLPRTKLKRSRLSRGEPTLYRRTVELIDLVVRQREGAEPLFRISYRTALSLIRSLAKKSGATSQPDNMPVRWKDLRSGMACHLLRMGWTGDEVNARLGHAPNSDGLNRYVNYLALRRDEPKHRMLLRAQGQTDTTTPTAKRGRTVITCPHCHGVLAGFDLPAAEDVCNDIEAGAKQGGDGMPVSPESPCVAAERCGAEYGEGRVHDIAQVACPQGIRPIRI